MNEEIIMNKHRLIFGRKFMCMQYTCILHTILSVSKSIVIDTNLSIMYSNEFLVKFNDLQ